VFLMTVRHKQRNDCKIICLSFYAYSFIGFAVVLRCDASDALATTECNYIKTIGTSYTDEASSHREISQEVANAIEAGMFGIMSSMSVSTTTGTKQLIFPINLYTLMR
jgi:hypothetical protein